MIKANEKVDPKIIDRIKKLLVLATSPNNHEAELAMNQAKRLMLKYSLQYDELNPDEFKDSVAVEIWSNAVLKSPGLIDQIPYIIPIIAPIFGVHGMIRQARSGVGKVLEFQLVGFPANIEIAKFALDSILIQGIFEAREKYKIHRTTTFGQSFWHGFRIGLNLKFGKVKYEGNGIALYDKVKQHVQNLVEGTWNEKAKFDGVAHNYGVEAGKKAELRSAITQKNEGKLLN